MPFQTTSILAGDRARLACLVALAGFLTLPMVLFDRIPCNDTAGRYAPAIRDFAAGRCRQAFHPRTQPLLTLTGGGLARAGVPPFPAAKAASALFFALAVIPLFLLQRALFGRGAALVAAGLFVLCPTLLRYAGMGLRDSANTAGLLLAVLGLVRFQATRRTSAALCTAVGAAGMCLARGESLPFAGLCLLALLVLDHAPAGPGQPRRLPRRALAACALWTVLLLPWVWHCTRMTGYPITASQMVHLWHKLELLLGTPSLQLVTPQLPPEPERWLPPPGTPTYGTYVPPLAAALGVLASVWDGLNPAYLLSALAAALLRCRRRQWTRAEALVAAALAAYLITLILSVLASGSGFVSKRYVATAMPLLLGWTALAGIGVWTALRRRWPRTRPWLCLLLAGLAVVLAWDGTKSARPPWRVRRRLERQAVRDCGRWLEAARMAAPTRFARPPLTCSATAYRSERRPLLLGGEPDVAWLGQGEHVGWTEINLERFSAAQLAELCTAWQADFVVWDRELRQLCPDLADLDRLPAPFRIAYGRWRDLARPLVILELADNGHGVPGSAPAPPPGPQPP